MRTVPVVEMKSHLSALLADVEQGEEIAISRHGRIIARLVPDRPEMAAEAFRSIWAEGGMDLEAPADQTPEPVADLD